MKDVPYASMFAAVLLVIIFLAVHINYPSQAGIENPTILLPTLIDFVTGIVVSLAGAHRKSVMLNVNAPQDPRFDILPV